MDKSIHDTPSSRVYKRNINNTTIQALLAKASKEENPEQRNNYFQQAIQTLNTSRIKDVKSQNYSISGFINYYQNKQISLTQKNLQNACVSEKTNIIDILGQGQVCFYAKDYAKALEFFKEALQKNPKLPGRARLGLAYCFFIQKKFELAKRAFQRVIDLDPQVYEAYLGLAILASQRKEWNVYIKNLNKAYEVNKESPLVLYYITEFYYIQQDYENIKKTALKAISNLKLMPKIIIDSDKLKTYQKPTRFDFYDIKSRLYQMIASCFHREQDRLMTLFQTIQKKFDLAQKFYEQSLASNRVNIQSNFGLAQIFIHNLELLCLLNKQLIKKQQYDQAFKRLDDIRQQCPENEKELTFELFKPLAYLQSKQALSQNKQTQQQYYQKALNFFPQDYEALLEYANNLTDLEPADSLRYFRQALNVLLANNENINPEIYNNIGVLEMHLRNFPKALEAFEQALLIANQAGQPDGPKCFSKNVQSQTGEIEGDQNTEESETKRKSFLCTVKFNLATMYEDLKDIEKAYQQYKEVLEICPYYLDAYARLAYLEFLKGNLQNAIRYCDEAVEKKEEAKSNIVRPDLILCMKGYIQSQYEDDHSARDSFAIIKKQGFNDNYSKLYVFYMDYEQLTEKRDNSEFSKKMMVIGEKIKEILGMDSTNVQALIVLGVVLAENGQIQEAKEIFNVLKENITIFPNILFNLGQIQFLEKNFQEALMYFKKYQEKCPFSKDEYLLTQTALCYLHLEKFKEAKSIIKKLILRQPSSLIHRYNFFIILLIEVEKIFSDSTRTLKEKENAFIICKRAKEFLDFFKHDPKCKKSRYQDHFSTQVKQKKMDYFNSIMEQCETKRMMLDSNMVSFEKMLNEARHKQQSSIEKQYNEEEIFRKWKMDQEIKKQRLEEEKRLQEQKERERNAERIRKQQEIQQILEENKKMEESKKKQQSDKGSRSKSNKRKLHQADDEEQFIDDEEDEVNEILNDEALAGSDNQDYEPDNMDFGEDQVMLADQEQEQEQDIYEMPQKSYSKNSSKEPPLQKKKKILKKKQRSTENESNEQDDIFNEEVDDIFNDDNHGDQEEINHQIEEEKSQEDNVVEKQSKKINRRKNIVDDDEDSEPKIFEDN